MSPTMTLATARRVLTQLRHDPRTVALLVVVPALLLVMLRYVFNSKSFFASISPALLGFFPFLLMFLVTSITTLRERSSGTLERLLTTPMAKLDLLLGYALAFALLALLQVSLAVGVSVWLGLAIGTAVWPVLLVAILDAVLGVALGLLASAFARTEFQAVQFMPIVVLPQLLLCGLFHPRAEMAEVLRWLSAVMPLSYAVEAVRRAADGAALAGLFWRDVLVVLAVTALALGLAAGTLPRATR